MKSSTVPVPCTLTWENPQVPPTRYRTWHNQLLLSGPPHPHSYEWKNDNKTGQSSTHTSRTSCKAPLGCCMHVHQPAVQVCKAGESIALRKSSTNTMEGLLWADPIDKARHLSNIRLLWRYRTFSRGPIQISPQTRIQACTTCTKEVPIHLESAFKEEIESLVKQGILEEVKEHTDWVNSYVIVEKGHWQSPFTKSHS